MRYFAHPKQGITIEISGRKATKTTVKRKYPIGPKALFAMFGTLYVLGVIIMCFYIHAVTYTKIFPNVSVFGVNVGSLTKQEAETLLNEKIADSIYDNTITVKFGKQELKLNVADLFTADVEKTVENAYRAGRGSNILSKLVKSVYAMRKSYTVPLVITTDGDKLKNELLDFAINCEEGHNFYTFNDKFTVMTVDISNPYGYLLDIDSTAEVISKRVADGIFDDVLFIAKYKITKDDKELLYNRMQIPAVNASMEIEDNELIIKPHRVGITVDRDKLFKHIENGDTLFAMVVSPTMPRLTEDDFSVSSFPDVLGEYETNYDPINDALAKNIQRNASLINSVIIAPGKLFSYNGIVGDRTAERGFFPVTTGDEGYNGGASQVASTLFAAQLMADLETEQRRNNDFMISYIEAGMDAKVEYGVSDYAFKNTNEYPIKIEADASNGTLKIRIMGTKSDKTTDIQIINHVISEENYTTTYEQTAELGDGYTLVKQQGHNGQTVDTYKVFYRDGIEEFRDFMHKSVYKPVNEVILYGGQDSYIAY